MRRRTPRVRVARPDAPGSDLSRPNRGHHRFSCSAIPLPTTIVHLPHVPHRRCHLITLIDRGNPDLVAAIREEIDARRPHHLRPFHGSGALPPDWGYYLSPERRPGRPGDFLTAPEAHPFFGITLARQIAECWERLGRPEPFVVREYGPGVGGLAWDIIGGLSARGAGLPRRAPVPPRGAESAPPGAGAGCLCRGGTRRLVRGEVPAPTWSRSPASSSPTRWPMPSASTA